MSMHTDERPEAGGRWPQPGALMPQAALHGAEPGQAIVIIALVMIALLGFIALTIDGGGLYLLRRQATNAADAASIAAAYSRCTSGDYALAAEQAAERNGFDAAALSVNAWDAADGTMYVEAIVTAEKPKYFAQVVYDGPLLVEGRSVAFCRREGGGADGNQYAYYAGANCPLALDFRADGSTYYGNIHSEGGVRIWGDNLNFWGEGDYKGDLTLRSHTAYFNGEACTTTVDDPDTTCNDDLNHNSEAYVCDDIDWPVEWDIAAFYPPGDPSDPSPAPGGAQALAAGDYYYSPQEYDDPEPDNGWIGDNRQRIGSDWLMGYYANCTGDGCELKCGLYYSSEGIHITKQIRGIWGIDENCSGVTFVSDGPIWIQHSDSSIQSNFVPNLLAFSNYGVDPCQAPPVCNTADDEDIVPKAIRVTLDHSSFVGNFFAPRGNIDAYGDGNSTVNGCFIGYTIQQYGNNNTITCQPGDLQPSYIIQYSE